MNNNATEQSELGAFNELRAAATACKEPFCRSDKGSFTHGDRLQPHYSEHNEAQLKEGDGRKDVHVFPSCSL